LLASASGRQTLRLALANWDTPLYLALSIAILLLVFKYSAPSDYKRFYLLYLPLVWAGVRQGVAGVAFIACVLQIAVVAVIEWSVEIDVSIFESQLLGVVLAPLGFFVGAAVDELKKASEDVKHTIRLAAAGDMATALAHELNQPITALSAYSNSCEILLERGDTGSDTLKDTVRRIVAESKRAVDVVKRLREYFHRGTTQLETIAFGTFLQAAMAESREFANARGVELEMLSLPPTAIQGDKAQMLIVVHNLLSNAVESAALHCKGRARVEVSAARQANGTVLVSIEDNGPGIPIAMVERIFEPFFSSKSSGFGLGLVISRAIVEAHGGKLWAEAADHGVFRMELHSVGDRNGTKS
jgi:two-component system, LuxR family, sensor kinase FixL